MLHVQVGHTNQPLPGHKNIHGSFALPPFFLEGHPVSISIRFYFPPSIGPRKTWSVQRIATQLQLPDQSVSQSKPTKQRFGFWDTPGMSFLCAESRHLAQLRTHIRHTHLHWKKTHRALDALAQKCMTRNKTNDFQTTRQPVWLVWIFVICTSLCRGRPPVQQPGRPCPARLAGVEAPAGDAAEAVASANWQVMFLDESKGRVLWMKHTMNE